MKTKNKTITAGELRKHLENVDDDTPVVISGGSDHTYLSFTDMRTDTVAVSKHGYAEWYGLTYASPGEKPIKALVIDTD